jgi:hypothetical protein
MNRRLPLASFPFAMLLCTSVGAVQYPCPPKVQLQGGTIAEKSVTPPFQPLVTAQVLWLTGANAYDGPPEQGAQLVPNKVSKQGKTETTHWVFEGDFSAGKWLSCDYAQGLARLTLQVAPTSRVCQAIASSNGKPEKLAVLLVCE